MCWPDMLDVVVKEKDGKYSMAVYKADYQFMMSMSFTP